MNDRLKNLITHIVEKYFNNLKLRLIGPQSVSRTMFFQMEDFDPKATILGAYLHANSIHGAGAEFPDPTSIKKLEAVANHYIDSMKAKTDADVIRTVSDALDSANRKSKIDNEDPQTWIRGEEGQDLLDNVKKELEDQRKKIVKAVDTLTQVELSNSQNIGSADGILAVAQKVGIADPVVFKIGILDDKRCRDCWHLWTMPDRVTPKLYKMSELSADPGKKAGSRNPTVVLTHPNCFTGDQILFTSEGGFRIEELLGKESLNVVVDNRAQRSRLSPHNLWLDRHCSGVSLKYSTPVVFTGEQECLKITLTNGMTFTVSKNHECWIDNDNAGERVKAADLKVGDKIPHVTDKMPFGKRSWMNLSELMGNCLGDGAFDGQTAHLMFYGEDIPYGQYLYKIFKNISNEHSKSHQPLSSELTVFPPDSKYNVARARFNSRVLGRLFYDLGFDKKNNPVPDILFSSTEETVSAFLRGLFSADGHSESHSIVLSSINKNMLSRVQMLLLMFGISSRIYEHQKPTVKAFKLYNGEYKDYKTQQSYRLMISGNNDRRLFTNLIGFGQSYKQKNALCGLVENTHRRSWRTARIKYIEDIGINFTYCLVEPETNTVTVNGIVTGQCRDVLTVLMPGFGFDSRGHVIYVGKDHDELKKQRGS